MERKYIIPLRQEWLKVPIYSRTRRAVKAVQKFISKHMKTEDVRIGKYLNLKLWERGNRHPPHKIEVIAEAKTDKVDGKEVKYVKVEIVGAPKEKPKETKKKKLVDKLKEKIAGKEDVVSEKETKGAEKEMKDIADEQKEEKKEAEKAIMKGQEKLAEAKHAPRKAQREEMRPEVKAGVEKHENQFPKDNKKSR